MFPGLLRTLSVVIVAAGMVAGLAPDPAAVADPDQDQKFFDLLGQKEIPPVDNANSLIGTAKKVCGKLDDGMAVGDLVELIRNNGFNENPLTRLQPQDRITRTITQFITASVEAYCPYDRSKIASIAAFRAAQPRIELVSLTEPLIAGDIAPTKPLPVPVQSAPAPQEIAPTPQQKQAPAPRQVQPAPPQRVEAPPPAAPEPATPAPGTGGGTEPASPTPDQPAPPGHIRLAP